MTKELGFRIDFSGLFGQNKQTGKRAEQRLDDSAGGVSQAAFVEQNGSSSGLPRVGLSVQTGGTSAEYSASLYEGQPEQFGKIVVFEPHLRVNRGDRGVDAGPDMAGQTGRNLQDNYDADIAQAAANSIGKPVLHTRTVNFGDETLKGKLQAQGYRPRRGYPQFYDKVYDPSET